MTSFARLYTLLLFAAFGVLFGTLTLPNQLHLGRKSHPVEPNVVPWYNSETQLFNEFVVRLFGFTCLGIVVAMLTNSYPLGIIAAEIPCGISFFLRYLYGVSQGLPDRLNHSMLLWAVIAALDIVVNGLAMLRNRQLKRYVRLFDILGCCSVGLAGYFLFPMLGGHIMPPDTVAWFLPEARTIVSFNFQLLSAATLLFGFFAFFESTTYPAQFTVVLLMFSVVMAFKFRELQLSHTLSAWQSPAVPLVYLGLTMVGALLNLYDYLYGRGGPQRRKQH